VRWKSARDGQHGFAAVVACPPMIDSVASFATVSLDELLAAMG